MRAFYAVLLTLGNFWCSVVVSVNFSSKLSNFEKNPKNKQQFFFFNPKKNQKSQNCNKKKPINPTKKIKKSIKIRIKNLKKSIKNTKKLQKFPKIVKKSKDLKKI